MIVAVVNSKGGVGKSTLAVHLAVWLSEQGHRILLVDCDAQQSSSVWIEESDPNIKTIRLNSANDILNKLPHLKGDADFIIADGPGSNTENSRALLFLADYAVMPCKASMLEVRALAKATDVLRQARDIRQGKPPAIIVLSMVGKNYRLTEDMKDAADKLDLPLANTSMTLRQVYADAPGQGTVVWRMGSRATKAASEMRRLFKELAPALNIIPLKSKASRSRKA